MITPNEMRDARKAKELTQIEVAIKVGVSAPAYRLWESGGTRPTRENEAKLREVLELGGVEYADDKHGEKDPRNS